MSSLPLAQRLSVIQPSATVAIATRAKELQAKGIDVLSFSVGEPDFETPEFIREAAKKAVDKGSSHYTAVRGTPALRDAIVADSKKRRGGVAHTPKQVVVSVGAKHSLFNLALALYNPGDEILIPAPYWVSYPEHARIVGAEPVIVQTTEENGFRLTPEALRNALTPKTKALVLCSPSNPTGAAYTAAQLGALAEVLRGHSCWIIADEIYGRLVYGGFEQKSILEVAPDLRDRIIIVDGVSKTYAMTGWRIGWALAPDAVADACDTIQGQATTNPAAISQLATVAALTGPDAPIEAMRQAFEKRRALIVERMRAIPGFVCPMPDGAFYVFPNVKALLGKRAGDRVLTDDIAVANWLLEDARCAVVPGTPFGAPGYLRFSYACSEAQIEEGTRRIAEAVSKLK